jgi:hypothetical protein
MVDTAAHEADFPGRCEALLDARNDATVGLVVEGEVVTTLVLGVEHHAAQRRRMNRS